MYCNLSIDSILRSPSAANNPAYQPDDTSENGIRAFRLGIVGVGYETCDLLYYLRQHTSCEDCEFLVIDRNRAALERSGADTLVLLSYDGHADTRTPLEHIAAQADREQLHAILKPYDLLFVVAILGGYTATGIVTDIARVARATDALTIGVVIPPFSYETIDRINCAQYGIAELEASLDALLVCDPNKFLQQPGSKLRDACAAVNAAVLHVVDGVVEPFSKLGYIGFDFSDTVTIFRNAGHVAVGFAQASGANFVGDALEQALRYPLLDQIPLSPLPSGSRLTARCSRNLTKTPTSSTAWPGMTTLLKIRSSLPFSPLMAAQRRRISIPMTVVRANLSRAAFSGGAC